MACNTAFDLEAHRGGRGLLPENTLPAFANALSMGVDTLELDIGVTADGALVISHERGLNPDLARDAKGDYVATPDLLSLHNTELRQVSIVSLQSVAVVDDH